MVGDSLSNKKYNFNTKLKISIVFISIKKVFFNSKILAEPMKRCGYKK